ncbi:MAG: hypothetical protein ACTSQW_09550 [Promethearchaeota archaeon]
MSIKISDKKFYNNYFLLEFELSDIVISFRELLGYIGVKDIYSGEEEIPFQEKSIEFQKIMLSEFIT